MFKIRFIYAGNSHPPEVYLPFVTEVAHQAPHLEYFALYDGKTHYKKRVRGEWTICDEAEFPEHF